jgi:hypothetical protein
MAQDAARDYFPAKDGECEQCAKERIKRLDEELGRLRRELDAVQIELGKRQEIE